MLLGLKKEKEQLTGRVKAAARLTGPESEQVRTTVHVRKKGNYL